jgi:hypothetical protein
MLSEPVSAQEVGGGGLILIFMCGATGGSVDVKDRMFEGLFSLTLSKFLFKFLLSWSFMLLSP